MEFRTFVFQKKLIQKVVDRKESFLKASRRKHLWFIEKSRVSTQRDRKGMEAGLKSKLQFYL